MSSIKSTRTWYEMAMSSTGKSDITFVRASGTEDEGISRRLLYPKIRVVVIPTAAKMPPPKTTLAALFMLVTGTSFLLSGVYVYFANILTGSDRGLGLIVLGLLMFIPGSYTSFILYGAFQGWNGYDYSQVPSYDEED